LSEHHTQHQQGKTLDVAHKPRRDWAAALVSVRQPTRRSRIGRQWRCNACVPRRYALVQVSRGLKRAVTPGFRPLAPFVAEIASRNRITRHTHGPRSMSCWDCTETAPHNPKAHIKYAHHSLVYHPSTWPASLLPLASWRSLCWVRACAAHEPGLDGTLHAAV
jgi:hypothetical protein